MSSLEQAIDSLGITANRIADENIELRATLRELRAWIKFKLEYGPIEHRAPKESGGPYNQHPSGYAAVLVPDWEMRQKLALVEESLALARDARSVPPQVDPKASNGT